MGKFLKRPDKDGLILEWAAAIYDIVAELLRGPEVVSPLAKHDGALYLAQDFERYEAVTTSAIPARSGSQWGSGTANMLTVDSDGVESNLPGGTGMTVWNWTGGAIPKGVRIWFRFAYGLRVVVNQDCSGVP